MKKFIWMGILLFGFWMLLTYTFDMFSFFIGLIVVSFVLWFNRDLLLIESETDLYSFKGIIRLIRFFMVLLKEIVVANIQVAKIVLDPRMPIQPSFFKYPIKLKKPLNQVIYANGITLTPGTLTIDVQEDYFIIHALTDSAKNGLNGSDLEKAANQLEDYHE